jgi:peptide deformylase
MVLKIVHYNDPILHQKGEKIAKFDAGLVTLAADMVETMDAAAGVGLAAQQIGRALQLCVIDLRGCEIDFDWELDGAHPPLELFMPLALVNPVVSVAPGTPNETADEGCLSFKRIRGDVVRPEEITVKFHDERGVPHVLACNGLMARAVQHEVDHLNGVLFIERMTKKARAKVDDAIKELAKQTKAEAKAKSP